MQIIFATCDERPDATADDRQLLEAFGDAGVEVHARPWTAIDPVTDGTPVLVRSTWDYHLQPGRFRAWLDAMRAEGRSLLNPPGIMADNIDKVYLRHLERHGIAIPETRWLDAPEAAGIAATFDEAGWPCAVLKPRVGATAYATTLLQRGQRVDGLDLAPVQASGALLQEFLPEIADAGELSLVFIGGALSHTVRKRPGRGDFRVQGGYGGTSAPGRPSAEAVALARAALALVPAGAVYARVDLVETRRGPVLMELELIEPELYFRHAPASAAHLAAEVLARLRLPPT